MSWSRTDQARVTRRHVPGNRRGLLARIVHDDAPERQTLRSENVRLKVHPGPACTGYHGKVSLEGGQRIGRALSGLVQTGTLQPHT